MIETRILSTNAVGLITVGANPYKDMMAMYPLAPPCPTDAYKNAIKSSNGYIK